MSRRTRLSREEFDKIARRLEQGRSTRHQEARKPWRIGIDPGAHTGWAVVDDATGSVVRMGTSDFWRVCDMINAEYPPDSCVILVEDPNGNKPTWMKSDTPAVREKKSQNVGAVKREASLLIERLRQQGYEVYGIVPRSSKMDGALFARLVSPMRCSQHARDAAMLVWGQMDPRMLR